MAKPEYLMIWASAPIMKNTSTRLIGLAGGMLMSFSGTTLLKGDVRNLPFSYAFHEKWLKKGLPVKVSELDFSVTEISIPDDVIRHIDKLGLV